MTLSKNVITDKIIKKVNSMNINKSNKNRRKANNFINFNCQIIKSQLKKHNEYKSLLNKIDASTSCEPIFLSIKSNKQNQKKLTNLIFKSNTFKLFSKFLEKYKSTDNLQTENYQKQKLFLQRIQRSLDIFFIADKIYYLFNKERNNRKGDNKNINNNNNKLFNNDISNTHFSTIYFSSIGIKFKR